MKEMIRRFDECISEKANKMSLVELEQKIQDLYLPKKLWDQLQETSQKDKSLEKIPLSKLEFSPGARDIWGCGPSISKPWQI